MIAALIILAATAATPPATATAAAPPPASQPLTLQQRFDEAMALAQADDCINAIPIFEALKAERSFRTGTLAGAMVLTNQGRCLVRIGLYDLGERTIEQGLPMLRKHGDQFAIDIAGGLSSLGDVAMSRWDYAGAKRLYLQAHAMKGAYEPVILNVKLAQATAFDGGPEPLAYIGEAIRVAEAEAKTPKNVLAGLYTVRGRIMLNQGDNKGAYAELRRALAASGGLDLKVNLADIALRSDLAVAALLAGDQASAREFLAYTGAGRLKEENLRTPMSYEPPVCGTESGLRPEDFAIVEVAINEQGRVSSAQTTYTRGSAQVAAQFARSAREWVWHPDVIKATPPVFRHAAHIEVRCTTLGQEVPGLTTPWDDRFASWAAQTLGLDVRRFRDGNSVVNDLKSLAAREDVMADGLKKAAAEGWLLFLLSPAYPEFDKRLDQVIATARAANAPPHVINWLRLKQAYARVQIAEWMKDGPKAKMSDLLAIIREPEVADDALAANTVKLLAGTERYGRKQVDDWQALLKQTAQDERLTPHHPLRQLAYLSLANDAARREAYAEADSYFKATGLTEEQCALIGPKPVMKRLASIDYPSEAYASSFEGWIRLEFDILADGRTAGVRPIIAYPPFIFNKASVDGLKTSKFEPSYRPSGGAACSASRQGIVFGLPN